MNGRGGGSVRAQSGLRQRCSGSEHKCTGRAEKLRASAGLALVTANGGSGWGSKHWTGVQVRVAALASQSCKA